MTTNSIARTFISLDCPKNSGVVSTSIFTAAPPRPMAAKVGNARDSHRALTRREREVHHWLKCGKSNREIAEILGIAPATVSKHLERIYPKLGVENRSAAISASS